MKGSLEPQIPEEVDTYLTEVFGYHALDTTSSIFQILQNLTCIISTWQDKTLLSKLPPAFSLHTESQRTTSLITQYGPDSTEMHKTSHRHEHTHLKARLDKQAACADICWFNILFLQNLIWDGRNDCTKSWLRTLAIQSRTMCYPFSFSRLHFPAKFPQQQN